MQRTSVTLSDEEFAALQRLAVAEGQTVAQLVRLAIDRLLAQRSADDDSQRRRLDRLVSRVRSRIPEGLTAAEIENDITVARAEVREAHRARRH